MHTNNHKREHFKKTTMLSITGLFMAFGIAIYETIFAIYLDSFNISESTIGFISAITILIATITSFLATPLLEKLHEKKIFILSILVYILSFIGIILFENLYLLIFLIIILSIASILRMDSFDILYRDESSKKDLNENEGLLYALQNIGWLFGPIMAGYILKVYNYKAVFITTILFMVLGLTHFYTLGIKNKHHRKKVDSNIFKNLKSFLKNKKLYLPYAMSAGIEVWWVLIFIYTPLFIINNNLPVEYIGYFLAASRIPLVLLEYKIGKLSSKYGFKLFFMLGFGSLIFISLILFFSTNIYFNLVLLSLASIPMAFIEPLQDSYFFKKVSNANEEKYYPIYATAGELGSFISKLAIATTLLFLQTNFAYLTIAILMSIFTYLASKI